MTALRHVFFVSDGTGITAETLGNTLLTQFEGVEFKTLTLPFVTSADKAQVTLEYINHIAATTNQRPIVFSTTVADEVRDVLRRSRGLFLDLFDSFIPAIEGELSSKSSHARGLAHGMSDPTRYNARINAMNFAMEHDDGQSSRDLAQAVVILIAPSRCGKTPTSLYLALQHGVNAANFPLTDEDLHELRLPRALGGLEGKLFGLTSDPERLSQVRGERRPGSKYASLAQCAYECRQAEQLYRRFGIPCLNSTNMSIEEIATMVIQEKHLKR
jgi:regulator of PEP synthase PpsR (kinase-PPPase family)